MSNSNTGGTAAGLQSFSKAELIAMMEAKLVEDAERERLAGVTIEREAGVSKAGKPFDVLQIKGGEFGWRGMNLKPAMWRRLKSLIPDIDAAMSKHYPSETL